MTERIGTDKNSGKLESQEKEKGQSGLTNEPVEVELLGDRDVHIVGDLPHENILNNSASDVNEMNARNMPEPVQVDKENVIEGMTSPSKSKPRGRCGLSDRSSNTVLSANVDEFDPRATGSVKTYSRRSRSRSNEKSKQHSTLNEDVKKQQSLSKASRQSVASRKISHDDQDEGLKETSEVVDADAIMERQKTTTESGDDKAVKNANGQSGNCQKEDHVICIESGEEPVELMLTPPVRKKRIFKTKTKGPDIGSIHAMQNQQENSPPVSDPYLFVVGDTPVAKGKKRGRPRSKDKKEKPASELFTVAHKDKKKSVRFSESASNKLFVYNAELEKSFGESSIVAHHDASASEPISTAQDRPTVQDGDSLFDFHSEDSSTMPTTRSSTRSKTRQKKTAKEDKVDNVVEDNSAGTTSSSKGQRGRKSRKSVEDHSCTAEVREKEVSKLASWIGEAEDHDLLFSTQEAAESIESLSADEAAEQGLDEEQDRSNEDGVLVLTADEDDDSNDGYCLRGPLPDDRQSRKAIRRGSLSDFDSVSVREVAGQNIQYEIVEITEGEENRIKTDLTKAQQQLGAKQKPSCTVKVTDKVTPTVSPADLTVSQSNISVVAETQDTVTTVPDTCQSKLQTPVVPGIKQTLLHKRSQAFSATPKHDTPLSASNSIIVSPSPALNLALGRQSRAEGLRKRLDRNDEHLSEDTSTKTAESAAGSHKDQSSQQNENGAKTVDEVKEDYVSVTETDDMKEGSTAVDVNDTATRSRKVAESSSHRTGEEADHQNNERCVADQSNNGSNECCFFM
jgi:hypothetical protein